MPTQNPFITRRPARRLSWAGLILLGFSTMARAQPSSGELLRDIEHLQVVGSVLYVAAHPDDENTRLIAWLVGERGVRTGYLSLTRGGGGQNLIGPERSELLGVVRTGELLAARSVDGAEQRFTRMRDFGYSKSAEEALATWGHDEALDDVVRAVRDFRPDVIVTRFPAEGKTHGHHLASARLAAEAFALAADPAYVTPGLAPWAADRLLYNRSTWNLPPDADTSAWVHADVGSFDPRVGRSFGEVAATSRTMHKSQGFGSAPVVGPIDEYFVPLAGTPVDPGQDLLAGLDLGWTRFAGTRPLLRALQTAARRFDPRRPQEVLPYLAEAHERLADVPDAGWRQIKTGAVERAMADAAGLWLVARADRAAVAPGGGLEVALTAVARSADVTLHEVRLSHGGRTGDGSDGRGGAVVAAGADLLAGRPWTATQTLDLPLDHAPTVPHWLAEAPSAARYTISDPALRTLADTPAPLQAAFDLTVAGRRLTVQVPVAYAWTDPVQGERVQAVEVLPPVTATFAQPVAVVPSGTDAVARLTLRATDGPAAGVLRLTAPPGVTVAPSAVPFDLGEAAPERIVEVRISADEGADAGDLVASLALEGAEGDGAPAAPALQQAVVDHPHLPRRTILSPAAQRVVPIALDRGDTGRIGYVTGPGDAVAAALRAAGYQVEELDDDAIVAGDLARFDAIVVGIRAYNTRPRLLAAHAQLMDYVAGGGRLVVQYNTNNRLDALDGPMGPHPFRIGRGRVTDEAAPMTPVDPEHPALVGPNRLGPDDFAGWVQERGLYFAETWDPAYETVFALHDAGEEPLAGSLLVARHGDGVFVYTGLSLFRQLPAGVPGAYRLLANLLAL